MEGDPPSLPPQMFTTSAQLLDLTDSMCARTPIRSRKFTADIYLTYRKTSGRTPGWKKVDWCFKVLGSGFLTPSPPHLYSCITPSRSMYSMLMSLRVIVRLVPPRLRETNSLLTRKPIANLVLQSTIERLYVGDAYCDIPRGVFIVRGENVLLLGEIVCPLFLCRFSCLCANY